MSEMEIKQLSCFDPLLCPALNRVHPNPLPVGEGISGTAVLLIMMFLRELCVSAVINVIMDALCITTRSRSG